MTHFAAPNDEGVNLVSGETAVIAAIAAKIASQGAAFAAEAHSILGPVAEAKTALRDHLVNHAEHPIHRIPEKLPKPTTLTVVDGASIKEQMYAAELIAVVATNADGLNVPENLPGQVLTEITIQPYRTANGRLKDGLMFMFELILAATLPHEVRFVDGATNTALMSISKALQEGGETADLFAAYAEQYNLVEAMALFAEPANGLIAALPKSDSTDVYLTRYGHEIHHEGLFRSNDRVFAQQVLEPGEMLDPYPVSDRNKETNNKNEYMDFNARRGGSDRVKALLSRLQEAVTPLLDATKSGDVYVTYFKPATSDTALKLEYRGDLRTAMRLAGLLTPEAVPGMIEPYPQYKVDQSAKRISGMTSLMKQQLIASLPPESAEYAQWLVQKYRT